MLSRSRPTLRPGRHATTTVPAITAPFRGRDGRPAPGLRSPGVAPWCARRGPTRRLHCRARRSPAPTPTGRPPGRDGHRAPGPGRRTSPARGRTRRRSPSVALPGRALGGCPSSASRCSPGAARAAAPRARSRVPIASPSAPGPRSGRRAMRSARPPSLPARCSPPARRSDSAASHARRSAEGDAPTPAAHPGPAGPLPGPPAHDRARPVRRCTPVGAPPLVDTAPPVPVGRAEPRLGPTINAAGGIQGSQLDAHPFGLGRQVGELGAWSGRQLGSPARRTRCPHQAPASAWRSAHTSARVRDPVTGSGELRDTLPTPARPPPLRRPRPPAVRRPPGCRPAPPHRPPPATVARAPARRSAARAAAGDPRPRPGPGPGAAARRRRRRRCHGHPGHRERRLKQPCSRRQERPPLRPTEVARERRWGRRGRGRCAPAPGDSATYPASR